MVHQDGHGMAPRPGWSRSDIGDFAVAKKPAELAMIKLIDSEVRAYYAANYPDDGFDMRVKGFRKERRTQYDAKVFLIAPGQEAPDDPLWEPEADLVCKLELEEYQRTDLWPGPGGLPKNWPTYNLLARKVPVGFLDPKKWDFKFFVKHSYFANAFWMADRDLVIEAHHKGRVVVEQTTLPDGIEKTCQMAFKVDADFILDHPRFFANDFGEITEAFRALAKEQGFVQ